VRAAAPAIDAYLQSKTVFGDTAIEIADPFLVRWPESQCPAHSLRKFHNVALPTDNSAEWACHLLLAAFMCAKVPRFAALRISCERRNFVEL